MTELIQIAHIKTDSGLVLLEDAANAYEKLRAMGEAETLNPETSLDAQSEAIRTAFYATQPDPIDGPRPYWCRAIFTEHPVLGAVVIVEETTGGKLYAVPFTEAESGVVFESRDRWQEVRMVYEVIDSSEESEPVESIRLSESAAGVSILSEGAVPAGDSGPLTMRVNLIEPGFGNKRDGHYYPPETLKRSAQAFVGAKMYETDHGEKSNRNWVSTVRRIAGFSPTGAPVAEVVVHDPDFAARVRNLSTSGMLEKLACSIYADGVVKAGTVDGKKAKIVSEIKADPLPDVDWVTRAGAGGKAVELVESNMEAISMDQEVGTEEGVQVLAASDVMLALLEADLPKVATMRLAESEYSSKEDLEAAIGAEREYIESLAPGGSSAPFGMGESETPNTGESNETEESLAEQETAILSKHGLGGSNNARS